eukprot:GGOE01014743.1.p1 GENE.GGOE01014743.1~~GGOE01014743.1.p1  ORF type:complete len:589 (-),score=56.47 GGOE01014743.1:52-1797(-)
MAPFSKELPREVAMHSDPQGRRIGSRSRGRRGGVPAEWMDGAEGDPPAELMDSASGAEDHRPGRWGDADWMDSSEGDPTAEIMDDAETHKHQTRTHGQGRLPVEWMTQSSADPPTAVLMDWQNRPHGAWLHPSRRAGVEPSIPVEWMTKGHADPCIPIFMDGVQRKGGRRSRSAVHWADGYRAEEAEAEEGRPAGSWSRFASRSALHRSKSALARVFHDTVHWMDGDDGVNDDAIMMSSDKSSRPTISRSCRGDTRGQGPEHVEYMDGFDCTPADWTKMDATCQYPRARSRSASRVSGRSARRGSHLDVLWMDGYGSDPLEATAMDLSRCSSPPSELGSSAQQSPTAVPCKALPHHSLRRLLRPTRDGFRDFCSASVQWMDGLLSDPAEAEMLDVPRASMQEATKTSDSAVPTQTHSNAKHEFREVRRAPGSCSVVGSTSSFSIGIPLPAMVLVERSARVPDSMEGPLQAVRTPMPTLDRSVWSLSPVSRAESGHGGRCSPVSAASTVEMHRDESTTVVGVPINAVPPPLVSPFSSPRRSSTRREARVRSSSLLTRLRWFLWPPSQSSAPQPSPSPLESVP